MLLWIQEVIFRKVRRYVLTFFKNKKVSVIKKLLRGKTIEKAFLGNTYGFTNGIHGSVW